MNQDWRPGLPCRGRSRNHNPIPGGFTLKPNVVTGLFALALLTLVQQGALSQTQITFHDSTDNRPNWSPDGSQIVFRSERSGNPDVWKIPATGGDATQLTTHEARDGNPDWSPDDSRIAFHSNRIGDQHDIWWIPAGGGPEVRLTTDPSPDLNPAWSPDGSLIAFNSSRAGSFDIWTIPLPAAGDGAEQITTWAGRDRNPAWSPDGSLIAFNSNQFWGDDNIWVVPATGGIPTQITFHDGSDEVPCWSPNGKFIAFTSTRSGNQDIWAILANGDSASLRQITFDASDDRHPSWSPDGSLIAFSSERSGNWDIWVTDPTPALSEVEPNGLALATGLRGVSPNPFNPRTTIRLSVSSPADRLELGIYDVSGRLVRQLLVGSTEPGIHNVAWDGRNESGSVVPSGMYLARLRTNGIRESAKLLLLK